MSDPKLQRTNIIDLTGQVFGRLTILYEGPRIRGRISWVGLCECGNYKNVTTQNLRAGCTKSCGCLNDDVRRERSYTEEEMQLYSRWKDMMDRCHNSKNKRYKDYGGRGITVCQEWQDKVEGRKAFVTWAQLNGFRQELELDRANNNEGYSPGNCRWVTRKENCNNTRSTVFVEISGQKVLLREAIKEYRSDLHFSTVFDRIKRGWSVEEALLTPNTKKKTTD